jgi:hypothetical protein
MMTKLLPLFILFALSLSACEQQQQGSRDVGAKPKEMIDKVTNDLNAAQELANDKMKGAESEEALEDSRK